MEPKELYDKLFGAKMYTNSYEQFKQDYKTPADIADLHGKLKQVKAYDGDLASFQSDYFTVKKKVSSQGSAFNWGTGEVDVQKLSSAQPTVPTAGKKSDDITISGGLEFNWSTGEVKKSAFERNKDSIYQLTVTNQANQPFQEEAQSIDSEVTDVTLAQAGMGLVESVNQGFYKQAIGGTLKGAGELITKGHNKMFGDNAKVDESWLYQAGEAIQSAFGEGGIAAPTSTPEMLNSDVGQIGAGIGQMTAMILTGGAGSGSAAMSGVAKSAPILEVAAKSLFSRPAMMGTMQIVGDGADKIREEKSVVDQMDRDGYVKLNIGMGMDEKAAGDKYDKLKSTSADDLISEMLPTWFMEGSTEGLMVGEWFKRFNNATGGSFGKVFMEKAKDVTVGTFEGAAQEALQAWMENATAKEVYDYTLETTDGMAQSAKIGGAVQFILETVSAALGVKNRGATGDDKAFLDKAQEEIENRKKLLAKNLDNALIETVDMKAVQAELEKKVATGEMTQDEAKAQAREIETQKSAIQKIPEDQKTNPEVVETMVEKTKVDEEIAAKKEEIKSIDPAFQQDAKNDIAALEVKSAELALQVAEKAGVTPDEKAVKLLGPKEGEPRPIAKEPETPKMAPVTAGELEVGKTYYNEEFDRNYVFTGASDSGMLLFDKVAKKGEVLMTTSIDSMPESPFMKKLFGSKTEQSQEVQKSEPPQEPIASGMAQEAIGQAIATVDEVKKTVLTKRAYEGEVRSGVKAYLEEKGLTRERVSQVERSAQAQQMVDDIGEDMAVEAVRMGEVKGALASATLFDVIKRIDDRMSSSEDPADIDYLAQNQADLIEMLNDMAFEGGEFNSQFAREYMESDIGWNFAAKKNEYVKMFGSIPPEVEAKFAELDSHLRELRGKLKDAEERAKRAADAATIEAIRGEANKKPPTQKNIAVAGKELAKKIRKGKLSRPGTFSAASPASLVWDAAVEIAATAVEAGTALAEAVRLGVEHIRASAWYNSLPSDKKLAAEQEYVDFLTEQEDSVGALKVPKSLIRDLVGSGINDINELVDAVRGSLGLTEETDREIRDAITEYGKTINMTKDEVSVEVRRLRRVGRLISALEDVAEKKRPLRSGLQRDKMTAEERGLRKQLNEEMKGLPIDEETLMNEQKTALDAAKNRLKNQIEDMEREISSGEQVRRTAKSLEGDQELESLRKKRDELKKEYDEVFKTEEAMEARRLEETKKRTKKSIAEFERRLAEKDFAKKERKPLLEDNELIELRAEKLRIKEEYDKAFYAAEVKNRKMRDNVIAAIWEAWGLTRVLTASLDASFMFVQGGVMTVSNPRHAAEAFREAFAAMKSEARADGFARKMKSQEWYPLAKQSKLALTEAHSGIKSSEELFFSGWSDFLWNGIMTPFKLIGKYDAAVAKNPFKATERAAVAYLDTLRIMKFLEMLDGPLKGKNFSENKQEFRDVADAINTLTGRASLGKLEAISQPLTKLIFSPRNWASQVKMFSPYSLYYFSSLTPSARKMALLSLGKFVAFNTGMMLLLAAAFNNDDDDETGVEFDPRSSDFMKLKLGDTRVDSWGGKVQQVTFASRMIMDFLYDFGIGGGGFKNKKGQVLPLGMKNKTSDKKDLILQQFFNKLSPSARLVYNYTNAQRTKDGKQDDFGNEYSLGEDVKNSLYPMYISTIAELNQDGFDVSDALLTFLAFMGYGINTYGQKKKDDKK